MTAQLPAAEDLREPPPSVAYVYLVCGIGLTLIILSFVLGLVTSAPKRGYDVHSMDGVRSLLCDIGMIVIGSVVSM